VGEFLRWAKEEKKDFQPGKLYFWIGKFHLKMLAFNPGSPPLDLTIHQP
jgi:hypothetical protein